MERDMCSNLEWQLNIEFSMVKELEQKVRCDFKSHVRPPVPCVLLRALHRALTSRRSLRYPLLD